MMEGMVEYVSVSRPEGITHPSIDELLETTESKYSLVIYAAKRARQINAYFTPTEGMLRYVGPLVDADHQEKPLSIAMREIHAGAVRAVSIAEQEAAAAEAAAAAAEEFGDGGFALDEGTEFVLTTVETEEPMAELTDPGVMEEEQP